MTTRVLIVEDHPKTAALLARGLQERGFAVDVAPTGEQATRLGSETNYDVVVLDLMLPDVDGLEVLRRIRGAGATSPVIVVTARDSEEDRLLALDAGADDFLRKPFAFEELLQRLKRLAEGGDSL